MGSGFGHGRKGYVDPQCPALKPASGLDPLNFSYPTSVSLHSLHTAATALSSLLPCSTAPPPSSAVSLSGKGQ